MYQKRFLNEKPVKNPIVTLPRDRTCQADRKQE